MKRILIASIVGLGVLSLGSLALAQQKKPAGKGSPPPKVKNYDFDADLVDGELVKPEGEFMNARKFAEHGSLIRVRTDFIREIVKSAEDL